MKTVIVLPTYNERENIQKLIPLLQKEFKKIKQFTMHILVVDDKSPDGTAQEVKKLQKKYSNIHLISGDKEGLGVAYLRGFKHATKKLKADVMMMMDSDLQHPPSLVPQFMKEIDNGYDVVIGSRYISGGGTPDWNLKRKIISRGGNFFARVVGDMYKVHDCTSGFRAIRVSSFNKINIDHLHTRGYAFLSTVLFELIHTGAKTKEIPLIFKDREFGETKLRSKDMVEFFFNSWRLRFKSSKRMIKFGVVGGSGIFVNLAIFATAQSILVSQFGNTNGVLLAASLIGDEISIIYNFFLNHFWTFKKSTNKDHILKKLLKFNLVAVASVLINNLVLFALHNWFGVWEILAKFIGICVAFAWNYLANTRWTWREKIE